MRRLMARMAGPCSHTSWNLCKGADMERIVLSLAAALLATKALCGSFEEPPRFGVNYYAGFAEEYRYLSENGLDVKAEIRRDVQHFKRLGLNSLRLHAFDAQFSDKEGHVVDNIHLDLLDFLIAECDRNGIRSFLTPIAWWWNSCYGDAKPGFSSDWTIRQMTSDPRALEMQKRFLSEFMNHTNRYSGCRYADDPAILGFELINEPHYPQGRQDDEVTAYIDRLVETMRNAGTSKPLFYNCWEGREKACAKSRIDGVTGNLYPTGLVADHELAGSQLGRVVASTLRPVAALADKPKVIYEFDSADVGGAYMYPAMARLFRHEGCWAAHQFQYDTLATADYNRAWKTHHLNLVYTPAKAISLAIAAEVFKRSPKGCAYVSDVRAMSFDCFRINAARGLSQMVTEEEYLYTADPVDPPVSPARLKRVWGVGSSAVAAVSGNGAYFLDKACNGIWRLQLYPNVLVLRDPYCGERSLKHALVREQRSVRLVLPDLGKTFRVRCVADGANVGSARDGTLNLYPGDYVVENVSGYGDDQAAIVKAAGVADFIVPAYMQPSDFEFLDASDSARHGFEGEPNYHKYTCPGPNGNIAFGLKASDEQFVKGVASQHSPVDAPSFERLFENPGKGRALKVVLRSADDKPGKLRINITLANQTYFGWDFPLEGDWRSVRVSVDDLQPCWGTENDKTAHPDLSLIRAVSYMFSHSAEVASVKVEY